ncbi:MAG: HEPN domain-containing protein [Planctomycetota bacterium]
MREAELLLKNGHLHASVNRLYYACFYAVSALLLTERQASASHSGVRALFDQRWIKTGRLPRIMGRCYHRLFDMRQKSDYADLAAFHKEDVQAWLQEAKEFVGEVFKIIEEKIPPT